MIAFINYRLLVTGFRKSFLCKRSVSIVALWRRQRQAERRNGLRCERSCAIVGQEGWDLKSPTTWRRFGKTALRSLTTECVTKGRACDAL